MQLMTKKNVEKLINNTLQTTHLYLLKILTENQIVCSKIENYENYVKELTKFERSKQK